MNGKWIAVPKLAAEVQENTLEKNLGQNKVEGYAMENQQRKVNVTHTLAVSFSRLFTHEFEEDLDIFWVIFILRKLHI